jgi:8-oxo-dGTP pyrophosphatase MutT (NUDIX family)
MPAIDEVLTDVRARAADPVDEREARSAAIFLRELERLEQPCDEHADPVHITGSVLITGPRGVILLKHRKLGIWVQPGGHVDPGETPAEAALREGVEETGLRLTLAEPQCVHVDVHPGPRGHTHLDMRYVCHAADNRDPEPPQGESQEVFWFSWAEAIEMADDGIRGLLLARMT